VLEILAIGFVLLCALVAILALAAVAANDKWKRRRVIAAFTLFAAYVALLCLRLVSNVGHFFLTRETEGSLDGVSFFLTPVATLGILVWALGPPRIKKLLIVVVAVAIGVVVFNYSRPLTGRSDRLYVQRHHVELNSLATDIMRYGRIRSLIWDYGHQVNDTWVLYPGDSTYSWEHAIPLSTALARDSIDPRVHADFQRRLAALHFMAFWADSNGVSFARFRDGGIAYLPRSSTVPPGIPWTNGRVGSALAPHWYYAGW